MSAAPRDAAPAGAAPRQDGPGLLTMYSPVAALLRGETLTVPLEATIRETLRRIEAARGDLVVVVDAAGRVPFGVFTLEDLVRRVALPAADLDQPIATVMTSGVITLGLQASAHQAVLTMARHGVRHLVVVDAEGALAGVLSQEQVLGLQWVGVREVGEQLRAARDVDELAAAARAIRRVAEALLARGTRTETLTQFVSALNDLLTVRVIEVTADRFDLPPVPFCWIALGSEGRLEQTFATDQDNGLVFDADEADAPRVREGLLPFARAVNEALAACGFPLCKGNVMASNPQWCLTLREWQAAFSRWMDTPDPEALLNASIFFDLRPIYGRVALAERLWAWLLPVAAARPLFLSAMARNALRHGPPLGRIRDFVFDSREFPHTLELKAFGSRLFEDGARVLALARAIPHTSTAERLRAVADAGGLERAGVAAMVDGLHFVHQLRLRSQVAAGVRPEAANRVDPRRLNDLDRAILKEALRQARRLQARIALDYRVDALG